jgi:RNA 2',3'-cyclic 3'-phosphodiesterase
VRLFVAADIDDHTRAQLPLVRDAIESAVAEAAVPPRVTWVRAELAHVTLRFIGEVPDAVGESATAVLASGFEMPPFEIHWTHLGTFPRAGRTARDGQERRGRRTFPKVIWIGAATGGESLARLAQLVNERLTPIVGAGDSRPFKAHLTIGRVRDAGRGVDWSEALAHARLEPTTTLVDHVTIYQSKLSPKGPTYTALCAASLRQKDS